jgi:hypothetical protein
MGFAMFGVVLVSVVFLGVVLVLGLVAILKAAQADIPEVVRAIGGWLRLIPVIQIGLRAATGEPRAVEPAEEEPGRQDANA